MWENSDSSVRAMGREEVFEPRATQSDGATGRGSCEQEPGDRYPNLSLLLPPGLQCPLWSKYSQKPGAKWSYRSCSSVTLHGRRLARGPGRGYIQAGGWW